jgi:hypothetical protein
MQAKPLLAGKQNDARKILCCPEKCFIHAA